MFGDTQYVGYLIGRVFLIGEPNHILKWKGYTENEEGVSDYDLLADRVEFDNAGVKLFRSNGFDFVVFFSMSSKMEIFKYDGGFILCEGLYFNASLNLSNGFDIQKKDTTSISIDLTDGNVIISDATIEGRLINSTLNGVFSVYQDNLNSYSFLSIEEGRYSVQKGELTIVEGDCVLSIVIFSKR